MEFRTISLVIIYFTTLATCAVRHTPKVKEEENEANPSERENLRSIRTTEDAYVQIGFNPTQFNFQQAKQQDYLKQRYAQQQQINVEKIAEFRKYPLSKDITELFDKSNSKLKQSEQNEYDWQPFTPKTKHHRQERSSEDNKKLEYIPVKVTRSTTKLEDKTTDEDKAPNKSQIIRQDDTDSGLGGHIIYVDPRILKQILELKAKRSQIQSRSFNEQSSGIDTNSLNDLIGKNPHIQLESLKRLLQQSHNNNFLPVIAGAQPFHNKDHTPITERTVDVPNPQTRPNIQVAHDQAQENQHTNQVITKEAFEQIQKQLDQASQFQVHQALEQAQQAAQAHVAAQHKAIEQAQRAILENVQKSLYESSQYENSQYESPQALRLVQQKVPDYTTHINPPLQHQQIAYSTPLPPQVVSPVHDVTRPTSKVQVTNYRTALTTAVPTVLHNTLEPEQQSYSTAQNVVSDVPQLRNIHIIRVTPVPTQLPKRFLIQPQFKHLLEAQKPKQQYKIKTVDHYAPNHLHQAIAQLQAEKVLLQQVQSHNNAILNSNKGLNRYVGQKVPVQQEREEQTVEKEAQPSANAYQHIVLEHREPEQLKKIYPEEEQTEENEELQYAAKYAFGYRIKDNKEGNDFGHQEKRTGRSAEGSYHVLLPDGRRQKVEYYADDNGYHAKVTYENVAEHK